MIEELHGADRVMLHFPYRPATVCGAKELAHGPFRSRRPALNITADRAKAYARAYYQKNREAIRAKVRARQARRREEIRAYQRRWTAADRARRPALALYRSAKRRAARLGIVFMLAPEQIVIPLVCPVLGIPIIAGAGTLRAGTPSIDRIDNAKGYVPDNVRVISHRANSLKRDMTLDEARLLVANWSAR